MIKLNQSYDARLKIHDELNDDAIIKLINLLKESIHDASIKFNNSDNEIYLTLEEECDDIDKLHDEVNLAFSLWSNNEDTAFSELVVFILPINKNTFIIKL